MAVAYSDGAANILLDNGVATAWPAASLLDIRTGAAPGPNLAPTGTLLAQIVLPAGPWAVAAARIKAKSGAWSVAAIAAGIAAHYRLKRAADPDTADASQVRQEGTCGLGAGDLSLDNTNIAVGQTVTANTFNESI